MILLSGHSLTPDRRVPIEKHSLRLRERESEADITPADMGGIGTESWLLDDVEPGAGIVWRVASIRHEFATATPTVHLEHMINSLRDRIMFGEVDAATMSGRLGATTCTAQEAIEYILSQQSDWVLYSFDFDDVEGPYKFNGDTLYDALSHVSSTLDGAWWSYDFSVYPFRLSITNKASGVGSELIPGRNLSAITKTVDKSGMYTRFYPIGKDDLHITGDYVSKNESTYGVIAKVETDLSLETEDELTAWANERLRKHADPAVTVEVEGLELADATGEGLDRMRLGRICRVPLSEFGVTIQERITELYYADKAHDRESVTITLSNRQDDVARDILHVIAEEIKTGSGRSGAGGRGAAKDQKEDHAWFEDTDEHVAMCAIGIIGVDSEGNPDWYRLSQLVVDGEGVHSMVQRVHYDQVEMYSIITQNEEMLRAEFQDNINSLHSEFQITAESLRVEFSNETASLHSELTITAASLRSEFVDESASVRSLITQEANRIGLVVEGYGAKAVVKRAAIQAAIVDNNGKLVSTITLDADQVYIGNEKSTAVINGKLNASDVTAEYLNAKIATIPNLTGIAATFSGNIVAAGLMAAGVYVGSGSSWTNISDGIASVRVDGPKSNVYTLQYKKFSDSSWQDAGTFSRATSLSGSWSGTTYTVTASPQGNTNTTSVSLDLTGSANIIGASVKHGNDVLDSKGAKLEENVSDKKVYVKLTGGSGSTIAQISTSDTFNAGVKAGIPTGATLGSKVTGTVYNVSIARGSYSAVASTIDVASAYTDARAGYYTATQYAAHYNEGRTTGATSLTISGASTSDATTKLMDGNYKWKITATTTKGDGTSYTKTYVVESKHDMGIRQSKSGATMTVTAACQPDGSHDAATKSRDYTLEYSNGQAHIMYAGTSYADLTCGGGGGSYTKYYGPNGETTFKMYYMRNGSYLSAGSKNWYYKS